MGSNRLFKRVAAVGLAGMMTAAMALPAMAADADTSISVTGLAVGDKVTAYKIAEPDQNVAAGWKLSGTYGSLTINDILDGVDTTEYGIIAATLTGGTADTLANTTWSKANPEAGMYLLKIEPANASTIYNPIVVSADYDTSNESNEVEAKKTSVTVAKSTSEAQRDVANGDVIDFTIASTVPCYPSNYVNPVYKISDTLSGPIKFTSITAVKLGGSDLTAETDYTITTGDKTFTIILTSTGIGKVQTAGIAQAIEVTYKGTVDTVTDSQDEFTDNVTRINNKAEVEYSNNPNDSTDTDKVDDETNHYSFSLDGNLAGSSTTVNEEIVKVGVDADGKDITNSETVTTTNKTPLQGATFTLFGGDSNKTYTATSDANGYLKFDGLDKGTYTLTETAAPAGYMVSTTTYTVVITPTYASDGKTLTSYTVNITDGENNTVTSTYNITNNATEVTKVTSSDGDQMSLFKDTKAKGLPSTGGIGTTIFYVFGATLVIGAGVVLITRRRVDAQ